MLRFRGEIYRATKNVQHAPVHVLARLLAEIGIKALRIPAAQLRHFPNSQPAQVPGNGGPHAADAPQIVDHCSDHTDNSFPLGSVK
jgi:hypothetical protein